MTSALSAAHRTADHVTPSSRRGDARAAEPAAWTETVESRNGRENQVSHQHLNGATDCMKCHQAHIQGRSTQPDDDFSQLPPFEKCSNGQFCLEKSTKFGPSEVQRDYRKKTTAVGLSSAATSCPR